MKLSKKLESTSLSRQNRHKTSNGYLSKYKEQYMTQKTDSLERHHPQAPASAYSSCQAAKYPTCENVNTLPGRSALSEIRLTTENESEYNSYQVQSAESQGHMSNQEVGSLMRLLASLKHRGRR